MYGMFIDYAGTNASRLHEMKNVPLNCVKRTYNVQMILPKMS